MRFLLAACVTLLACTAAVLWHDAIRSLPAQRSTPTDTYVSSIYRVSYQGFARTVFTAFVFLLGMGGLLRERDLGTAAFTLALPVSRVRLGLVPAATGLIEVVVLASLPGVVIVLVSPAVHETYPASQAIGFALLWSAGGAALFGVAFLGSALFAGEYTAFVVAEMMPFGHTVATQFIRIVRPASRPYLFTVQEIMSGLRMPYFDAPTRLLAGPFPVVPVTCWR